MKIETRSFHPIVQSDKSAVTIPVTKIKLDLTGIDKIRPEKSVATLASELKNLVRRDQKSKRRTYLLVKDRYG